MSWRSERHPRLGQALTDGDRWWVRAMTPEALPGILTAIGAAAWQPVVGGPTDEKTDAAWLIDIGELDAVRSVEPDNGVAHVEGGCTWDGLERTLSGRGLTLGPIPRWLVGRTIAETLGNGWTLRPSPRYGALRDGLLALRTALPNGTTACAVAPRRATGPDLGQLPLGAGHRAGLIADAHLRIWPQTAERAWRRLRLRGWNEARAAAMAIFAEGLRPAWWCLRRARRQVALELEMHGPRLQGQLDRLDAVLDGLTLTAQRDDDDEAAAWAAERFWRVGEDAAVRTMTPIAVVEGADLAAGVKGITKAEVWDLRPEGATVYVARAAEPPAVTDDWAALAERVFTALADGARP